MTNSYLKEKILVYRCKHSSWLKKFSNALATGTCVETAHKQNIVITSILDTLSNQVLTETTTNQITLIVTGEFTGCSPIYGLSYATTINGDNYTINVPCGENGLDALKTVLQEDGFIVEVTPNSLIVRYADLRLITSSEFIVRQFIYEDYITTNIVTSPYVNITYSCLTEEEICSLFSKLDELLKNCNCN